jgi:hypothetical protein
MSIDPCDCQRPVAVTRHRSSIVPPGFVSLRCPLIRRVRDAFATSESLPSRKMPYGTFLPTGGASPRRVRSVFLCRGLDLRPHARQQKLRGSRPDARSLQHRDLALLGADLPTHARDLVADPVQLHKALRSGTSPNFRSSLASPKSSVAGSCPQGRGERRGIVASSAKSLRDGTGPPPTT